MQPNAKTDKKEYLYFFFESCNTSYHLPDIMCQVWPGKLCDDTSSNNIPGQWQ